MRDACLLILLTLLRFCPASKQHCVFHVDTCTLGCASLFDRKMSPFPKFIHHSNMSRASAFKALSVVRRLHGFRNIFPCVQVPVSTNIEFAARSFRLTWYLSVCPCHEAHHLHCYHRCFLTVSAGHRDCHTWLCPCSERTTLKRTPHINDQSLRGTRSVLT